MFFVAAFLIIAGVALFVAAPLTGAVARRRREAGREALELDHWDHEQALAVQGLRELEFDREMSKLSDADYAALKASLEARALQAMTAIERIREEQRAANLAALEAKSRPRLVAKSEPEEPAAQLSAASAAALSEAPANPTASVPKRTPVDSASARRPRFCPQCGTRAPSSGNFCGDCGASLRGERVSARAS